MLAIGSLWSTNSTYQYSVFGVSAFDVVLLMFYTLTSSSIVVTFALRYTDLELYLLF